MEKQIVINDNLISYSQTGEGERAVIFLHGWRSNKEVWNQVIQRIRELENERIRIYSIDLPGFGGSSAPKTAWCVGDYAEIVKGYIEKLELKNVIIVGHSFGGRIGIKLAANPYPASGHPLPEGEGKLKGLILVDAAGFAMNANKKTIISAAAKLTKPFFKPKFMQGLRKKIYQKIGAEDYLATPELQQTYVKVISEDLTEDLKKITLPTLIITGENDKETPIEFGRKMNSLIPNSEFQILKNAGHYSFIDQPEEFVNNILEFMSS